MLKGHPKGLIVAFFTNMGERFGFYTMMAILVLFLQARYGLDEDKAGEIYSWFYFAIYALSMIGGMLADYTKKYKTVILFGQVIMFSGYALLAFPKLSLPVTIIGLFIIAFGNGLFKGNLQAVVGQMYDNERYTKMRDSGFMLFYMGINIGAFFAPFAATGIRNWWLEQNGFLHDGSLPKLCHQFLDGTLGNTEELQGLANHVSLNGPVENLGVFAQNYLDLFSRGYNFAFGIAAAGMIVSLLVYLFFNRLLPNKEKVAKAKSASVSSSPVHLVYAIFAGLAMTFLVAVLKDWDWVTGAAFGLFAMFVTWIISVSTKEEKPRVISLVLVFVVVIFFWMSFHQNGLTLTWFARDYTVKTVDPFTFMFFKLENILAVIALVVGAVLAIRRKASNNTRIWGVVLLVVGALSSIYLYNQAKPQNPIAPEIFESFNPLFIVTLTFAVMAFFDWLNKRNIEPSSPRKIGIGMAIAALGFVIILVASLNLVSPHELKYVVGDVTKYKPVPDASRVMPYWLISSYLVLTIAELFLSPMGLSFVSKVAPERFQGLMQGGWLLATAVGNKLLFVGSFFWAKLELWQLWAIFVIVCLVSALFIFSIIRRLEKATN